MLAPQDGHQLTVRHFWPRKPKLIAFRLTWHHAFDKLSSPWLPLAVKAEYEQDCSLVAKVLQDTPALACCVCTLLPSCHSATRAPLFFQRPGRSPRICFSGGVFAPWFTQEKRNSLACLLPRLSAVPCFPSNHLLCTDGKRV